MKQVPIIGIDFDNTMLCYDHLFIENALDLDLISPKNYKSKKELRDEIRLLPDGDVRWQKIQGFVYSRGIIRAHAFDGVRNFLSTCVRLSVKVHVVSHKTEYAAYDESKTNLRQAALDWMTANYFFDADTPVLAKEQVHFESTRLKKIERLRFLGCTHFIDDLEEVFYEADFPQNVEKILFSPQGDSGRSADMRVFESWDKIHEYFFN